MDPQQCKIESMHFNKADHYLVSMSCLFYRQERRYLISDRAAQTNLGSWGRVGDLWGLGILTLFSFIHTGYSWIHLCLKRIVAKNLKRK
jgi:hypothetical protein